MTTSEEQRLLPQRQLTPATGSDSSTLNRLKDCADRRGDRFGMLSRKMAREVENRESYDPMGVGMTPNNHPILAQFAHSLDRAADRDIEDISPLIVRKAQAGSLGARHRTSPPSMFATWRNEGVVPHRLLAGQAKVGGDGKGTGIV